MKKKFERVSEISARLREIADKLKAEERSLNDAEKKEVAALEREQDYLHLQMRSVSVPSPESTPATMREQFRDMVKASGRSTIDLQLREAGAADASVMTSADAKTGALLSLTAGDIVKPLRQALIYDKVGIQLPTGCAGEYEWPVVEAVEATIADEAVEVEAQKVELSKVPMVRQRIAVVAKASRESIYNSKGKLEAIVRELLPMAIAEKVNQVLTSVTKVTPGTALVGPFVGKTPEAVPFTFKGLAKAKATLLAKGVRSEKMCWVMTEARKAELEATPRDAGSGIMAIENGKLCGLPVFCSKFIGEDNIGLGDFTYCVCSQFGDFSLIVDPYTGAGSNSVRFALNAEFGTVTTRSEAFALFTEKK